MSKPQTLEEFNSEKAGRLESSPNGDLASLSHDLLAEMVRSKYFYNFTWMGLPVIQYPQDLIALQELIWETQPDVIIETGLAFGGSCVFYGSCLSHLPRRLGEDGFRSYPKVISIEKQIGQGVVEEVHARFKEIYCHVKLIEASSIDPENINIIKELVKGKRVMVCLDSAHTADHVRQELEIWSQLVSPGCPLVVFDTFVELMPKELYKDHECGPGNSPMTALSAFFRTHDEFETDEIDNKLLITSNPVGYLRRKL